MRYAALFGWAFLIYAAMFCTWSLFAVYGFTAGLAPKLIGGLVLFAISLIAGLSLRAQSAFDILPYSLSWALINALVDAAFVVPLFGWSVFFDWHVWVGYGILALAPLPAPLLRRFVFTRGMPSGI